MKTGPKRCSKKSFLRGYPKKPEFQNSEYEVYQIGFLNDLRSQNISFLALDTAHSNFFFHRSTEKNFRIPLNRTNRKKIVAIL
jgi:hypothetical protein